MTQKKKAGDNGAGLLTGVQGLAPAHVAIIMDGNGRWASARGLPRSAGHRAGVDAVRAIVEAAPECGITTLTLDDGPPIRHRPVARRRNSAMERNKQSFNLIEYE